MAIISDVEAAKKSLYQQIRGEPWLRGIGIGRVAGGRLGIQVRVAPGYAARIPSSVRGVTVETVEISYMPRKVNPSRVRPKTPRQRLADQHWYRVESRKAYHGHHLEMATEEGVYQATQQRDGSWRLISLDRRKSRIVAPKLPDLVHVRVAVVADQAELDGKPLSAMMVERLLDEEG